MRNGTVLGVLCVLGLSQAVLGQTTTIDFDSFTDGQNLHGVDLGGVTLTATDGVVQVVTDSSVPSVGYRSPLNAIIYERDTLDDYMTLTFEEAMSYVSIYTGDAGGDLDSVSMRLYDAPVGGNLLVTHTMSGFDGDPYENLDLGSSTPIYRAEIQINTNFGVGFDDLSFTTIPEPGVTGGLVLGLALLSRRRVR